MGRIDFLIGALALMLIGIAVALADDDVSIQTTVIHGQVMKLNSFIEVENCKSKSEEIKTTDQYGQVHVVKVSSCE